MEASRRKEQNSSRSEKVAGKNNFFDDNQDDDFSSYFSKKKSSNPFEDDEEGDFMSTRREEKPKSFDPYGASSGVPEEKALTARDLYLQEVKAIQDRTLDTTGRSLRLIDESQAVGVAAAQELLSQREQLENADRNLDNMNATLDQSQKHINNIKSIFGGIKNWWTSKPPTTADTGSGTSTDISSSPSLRDMIEKTPAGISTGRPAGVSSGVSAGRPAFGTDDNSPYRSTSSLQTGSTGSVQTGSSFLPMKSYDVVLDKNLDEMSLGLSRLRGLAEGLGGEILSQNQLLDSMNSKTERVDLKIGEQQKHMDKILGKKK